MNILVASDIHGSPESLLFILDKVRACRPDRVVLLGDLLYHGPRNPLPGGYGPKSMPDMFRTLMKLAPLTAVRGNCDAEVDCMLLPFPLADSAQLCLDGLDIYVSHGHRIPELPPMGNFMPGTVFLRGHTHVPRGESAGGFSFWNPGSLSLPKQGYPRSWAMIKDGIFSVYDMEGTRILSHAPGSQA